MAMSPTGHSNKSVCRAPLIEANRLHGQRARAYSWTTSQSLFMDNEPEPIHGQRARAYSWTTSQSLFMDNEPEPIHGQRARAYSWTTSQSLFMDNEPEPIHDIRCQGLPQKTNRFRLHPTQSCVPGRRCDQCLPTHSGSAQASSGMWDKPLMALSRMLANYHLHPYPHPTHHSHD